MSDLPNIPAMGTCLACTQLVVLHGRLTSEHLNADGNTCPAGGFAAAQNDGHDKGRRTAITHTNSAELAAAKLRDEFTAQISGAKVFAGWLEHYSLMIVQAETLAALWRETTTHGQMWKTFHKADRTMLRYDHSDPWDTARAVGCRSWVVEARWELLTEADAMSQEQAVAILREMTF